MPFSPQKCGRNISIEPTNAAGEVSRQERSPRPPQRTGSLTKISWKEELAMDATGGKRTHSTPRPSSWRGMCCRFKHFPKNLNCSDIRGVIQGEVVRELLRHRGRQQILQFVKHHWNINEFGVYLTVVRADSCPDCIPFPLPCARRAHRNPPSDIYSPNVGNKYPIQIYIFKNVHFQTLRGT